MKKFYFFLFIFSQIAFGQNNSLLDLQKKLDSEKDASAKLEIINEMVAIAFNGNIEQALIYAKKGVQLSDKVGDKNWQPKFYEMEGRMHANLLQLDSATFYFDKAMKGYQTIKDKRGQATTLFKMAWVLKKKGENEKALHKNLSALKLMEALDDKAGICDAMTRVSHNLTDQNRLKVALDYAEKAIKIADTYNLTSEKYYVNFNAGNVAMALENYQQSLDYYNAAATIAKKENLGLSSSADISNAQGNALKRLGRYNEALEKYKKCLAVAKEANYNNAIAASTANLGEINLLLGNYKEALGYQLETVRLQEQENDMSNLVENYHHVSEIYKQLGDYKLALSYKQKAYVLRDSIASEQSDATMSKLLTQYETEKKETTIATQKGQISQQKMIQKLYFGVLGLLVVLLAFVFIGLHNRNKSNRLLAVKNAENELLMKEIHHRVKNNLEVVSSLLALQSAQIDDPNTKDAMTESQNRVNSIGIVHQKLYQGVNLGAVEMKNYFLNLSESILDSFGAEDRVELKLAMENLDLDIDTAVPLGLIINELLTNTIKYAFPKGEKGAVTIKLEKQTNNILHLEVADNGIGKSGIIHGTGFGSQLVSLLTQQLNGTMSEENQNGTKLIFDFKLKTAA